MKIKIKQRDYCFQIEVVYSRRYFMITHTNKICADYTDVFSILLYA